MTEGDSTKEQAAPAEVLAGDKKRRASPTVRGYLYQFWLTVSAWIDLCPEELLFVEGAEDFDIVEGKEATTVQVKDNKASLTLTTSGALEAIGNHWSLRHANPGREISFKYVTTAAAGTETPGFDGAKGVEIWNLCRQAPMDSCREDIERIRAFLQKKESLGGELSQYLKTATAENLKKDLIDPLEWIYDQPALQGVEETVTNRLLDLGKVRGLTVSDAEKLAEQLCMKVARAACADTPGRLDFAELRKRLDQAVNIEVPREIVRRQEHTDALIKNLFADALDQGQTLPTIAAAPDLFAPPMPAPNTWRRQELVDRVRGSLKSGVIYLAGGTGIGKTTLVLQALDSAVNVVWASLRDRTTQEILHICRLLRVRVANSPPVYVVLDDLNATDDPRNLEHEIGQVAATVRKNKGALVVTSYAEAGPRLTTVVGLPENSVWNVPPFDVGEVQAFLQDEGCPESLAEKLSRVVWVHTSGHPQLVAARIGALKANGFHEPTADDFLDQPKDIQDARAEARAMVRAMPDVARRLLYRLSVPLPPLRREHILRIAAGDPPIGLAGEIFDTVVGPWFQQIGPGHYRISPLLSKSGEQVLSREEIKRLNADIATAFLVEKSLTPNEFSGMLMHALLGEADAVLAIAAKVFIGERRDIKKMLAEDLRWVPIVGLSTETHLPLSNKTVRQMFRLLQWEIAGLIAPRQLPSIAAAMDKEFSGDATELADILPRILHHSKLLIQKDYSLPVADVVSRVLELKRLVDLAETKEASVNIATDIPPMHKNMPRQKLVEMFTVAIMPRVRTVADLDALIDALEQLSESERNWLLAGLSVEDGELRIFFNSMWLSIAKDDKKGHEAYERVLARAIEAARRWGTHAWMRAATRTRSAVLDEMLDRRVDAERVVKEIAEEIGTSLNLDDQLAGIAYNRKDYGIALPIWEHILPQWRSDELYHDMQPVFSLRYAAISASKLGRWKDAVAYYDQAISRERQFDKPGWNIGLRADRAYALWMNGDYPNALRLFANVVAELQNLPNKPESFTEYAAQKLIGHTLSALAHPAGSISEYVPGMCSDPSPHKDIGTLPAVPTEFTWYLLHQIAADAGDKELASACADKIADVPFAFLRAMAALDRAKRAIESGELEVVPNYAAAFALEMVKSKQRDDIPIYAPDPDSLTAELTEPSMNVYARPALWAAVLRAKASEQDLSELIARWGSGVDSKYALMADELNSLEQFSGLSVVEWEQILKGESEPAERRLWAAVLLIGNEEVSMPDAVYAHTLLVSNAKDYKILWDAGGSSVDELIRKDWKKFSKAPFLLRSPKLHIDSIQTACDSAEKGWSAAARIVLAWNPATALNLPNDIRDSLRRIAANELGLADHGNRHSQG